MRVLAACSLGGAGHLMPLLPLLRAAEERGDEVLIAVPPTMESLSAQSGHRYRLCGAPPEDEVAAIRELLHSEPPERAAVLANRELFGRLCTAAMREGMLEIFDEWGPELVLRDPCEYASAMAAMSLGVPSAQVAVSLGQVEWASIALAEPVLEEHHAGVCDEIRSSPFLTRFPSSVDPSPFSSTWRIHDPVATAGALRRWDFGDPDAPLVYVTFGTVLPYMGFAAPLYRAALDAAAGTGARVLLSVGHHFDSSVLGSLPPNVRVEPWVAHSEVLAESALVVCHGGSGTVLGSLAAGVPLVVVPFFADQNPNGRWIAQAGAGVLVQGVSAEAGATKTTGGDLSDEGDPPGQAVLRLRTAMEAVLENPSFVRAAKRLGSEMSRTRGLEDALEMLSKPKR